MSARTEAIALIVAALLIYAAAPASVAVAAGLTLASAALLGARKGK